MRKENGVFWIALVFIAIPPALTSDSVGQHNKTEGINTGVALVHK